jgi:hypothetical protein
MIGAARVRCQDCEFAWYGRSSAHGLAVLGHCPRCGGELIFTDPDPKKLDPESEPSQEELEMEPSRVLGLPGGG